MGGATHANEAGQSLEAFDQRISIVIDLGFTYVSRSLHLDGKTRGYLSGLGWCAGQGSSLSYRGRNLVNEYKGILVVPGCSDKHVRCFTCFPAF